jgi:hypothetical protein
VAGTGERRTKGHRAPRARVFPRLTVLLAAIAVFVQLVALPYHHPQERHDLSIVAAELKATFGPTAILCTQGDDGSSPATHDRGPGACDAGCPLCQFGSQAALLEPPPPALPARLAVVDGVPPTRADFLRPRLGAIRLAQPRAPPAFA